MTDIFLQKIFCSYLGSGSACRSVKGQVVVWGNQVIKEALIYSVFPNSQNFKIPRYHLISRQGEKFKYLAWFDASSYETICWRDNLDQLIAILKAGDLDWIISVEKVRLSIAWWWLRCRVSFFNETKHGNH
jgi:diphosphomevalonate decarboxylase